MQSAWADRTMNDLVLQEMNENHEIREMTKTVLWVCHEKED